MYLVITNVASYLTFPTRSWSSEAKVQRCGCRGRMPRQACEGGWHGQWKVFLGWLWDCLIGSSYHFCFDWTCSLKAYSQPVAGRAGMAACCILGNAGFRRPWERWYCHCGCLWLVPASASGVVSRVAWDRCILGGLTSAIVLSLALKAVNQVNGL